MSLIFYVVGNVYHYVPTEFGWGYLVVHGDRVMVLTGVIAWLLMGASVGIVQSWTKPLNVARIVAWGTAMSVAWGAAALTTWAVRDTWPEIGYEPICVDCVFRFIWSGLVGGIVIAVLSGIAVLSRYVSVGASIIVGAAAVIFVTQATTQPFTQRRLAAARIIDDRGSNALFPKDCGFSEDGRVFASYQEYLEQGKVTNSEFDLWRAADWSRMITMPGSGASTPINYFGTPAQIEVAQDGLLHISSTVDKREITKVVWTSADVSPDGMFIVVPEGDNGPELHRASDNTFVLYLQVPDQFRGISPDRRLFAWPPDNGRELVGCDGYGGIWVWDIPR
jgi:hypothetical protein